MKKLMFILGFVAIQLPTLAQKSKVKAPAEIKVAMSPASWEFPANSVEFINKGNTPAMKILTTNDRIKLKDFAFRDGTIEFDLDEPAEPFTGIFFRMADNNETEYFYLRNARAGFPMAMDAAQYAAFNKGVNLWDLLDHFQGPAKISKTERNHIKLVVSGKQMLVYVNDTIPTLEIPRLEGNTTEGGIAFNGKSIISNLVIKPNVVEGLPAGEGFDPTNRDPRYIRSWQVNEPQPMPGGKELSFTDFPDADTKWTSINAERRGLINLTRLHGVNGRRYVWLRTMINSDKEQKRTLNFGFSDEVWVFVNRQPVYFDKNLYGSAVFRKEPDGRISIENSKFTVPLRKGDNEILIGLANDFFGWGIVARMDNMEGLYVNKNFIDQKIDPNTLSNYEGVYSGKDLPVKITVKRDGNRLTAQAATQAPIPLEYLGNNKFVFVQGNVELEFLPAQKQMILTESGRSATLDRE